MFHRLYEIDRVDILPAEYPDKVTQEDIRFLDIMDKNMKKVNGHYVLPLPFRDKDVFSKQLNLSFEKT